MIWGENPYFWKHPHGSIIGNFTPSWPSRDLSVKVIGHQGVRLRIFIQHMQQSWIIDLGRQLTKPRVMEKRCMTATCFFVKLCSAFKYSIWSKTASLKKKMVSQIFFQGSSKALCYIFYTSGEGMQQSGTRNAEHSSQSQSACHQRGWSQLNPSWCQLAVG